MDVRLLELLRCPQNGLRLMHGEAADKERFCTGEGELLVREDGALAYPVRDGIPLLVPGAALALPDKQG